MFRPPKTAIKNLLFSFQNDNCSISKRLLNTRFRGPKSAARITMVSASVGIMLGAGYSGYTHYKMNKKARAPVETVQFPVIKAPLLYKPTMKVHYEQDNSNLSLVLFQYRTCPFCCKVRTFLDYHGISYDVVEVDAVLRQAIKWSDYKKVPILLTKVEDGYQQLIESSAIISLLATYLRDENSQIKDLTDYYPISKYNNVDGKSVTDISNKYFVMHQNYINEEEKKIEAAEREWRQWSDSVLVHVISPNIYRTLDEAYESFNWFAEVGEWHKHFPAWECSLMINVGAFAMWLLSKRLKSRHNLDEDVRMSLYQAANHWMTNIQVKGSTFMGGEEPNLADLSVHGILSSMQGCRAFEEMRKHTTIGLWYDAVKDRIESRGKKIMAAT